MVMAGNSKRIAGSGLRDAGYVIRNVRYQEGGFFDVGSLIKPACLT